MVECYAEGCTKDAQPGALFPFCSQEHYREYANKQNRRVHELQTKSNISITEAIARCKAKAHQIREQKLRDGLPPQFDPYNVLND